MLRDEIAKYTELSGNDGWHTPIGIIGAYLDGYEKGKGEWIYTDGQHVCSKCNLYNGIESDFCPNCGADMRGESDE